MIEQIRPLTQDERQNARDAAYEAIGRAIGPRPGREQFTGHTAQKYPPVVTWIITLLCIVLLLAAFTPSAIRLYDIGSKTFGTSIPHRQSMQAVGLATILTAEIGQVVFSLALATLGTSRAARRLLYLCMAISTGIALVGNVQRAMPGNWFDPFGWLDALAPPLLVLGTAYVLKGQMLDAIQQRHANEKIYQEALYDWLVATSSPESHSKWSQVYANALRDTLRKANNRRKDTLEGLTTADWRALIYRELQADSWYETPDMLSETVPLVLHSNGNGHRNGHGVGVGIGGV